MDKTVFIARADAYTEKMCGDAVERVFEGIGAAELIGPETKILLKPNLLAKHEPGHAVTTHPEIVRAVIRACKRRGARAKNITLADSAGGLYNPGQTRALYKVAGLASVCEAEGVAAYDACESVKLKTDGRVVHEFELLKPVCEADLIIDLPKMKTHVMTGMTAACKNLFGSIPGLKKAEWHTRFPDKERFGEMLIDLLCAVKPGFAVLDAVDGLEGDGPAGGEVRHVGLVLGSCDLPNLDLAVCGLMGLDAMRVPYLRAAEGRGLCGRVFDAADLAGDVDAYAPIAGWLLPASYRRGGSGDVDFARSGRFPVFMQPLVQKAERMAAPHPKVNTAKCIGCGRCAEICPQHTIRMENGKSTIIDKDCIRCFCCHEMCPVKAIDVKQFKLFGL